MKKLFAALCAFCALTLLSACGSQQQEVTEIRVAFNQNEQHPQYLAMQELGEKFEQATNGRYHMTIYTNREKVTLGIALKTFWDAIPSLLLIVIVIGGILGGIFTATEGSAIAVVYATVLSLLYRSIKLRDLPGIVLEAAKVTGTITFMIGLSSIMSWAMAFTGIPDMVAQAVLGVTSNKILILLLINVILLVVGTFMDPTPAILIFTPIFLPICTSLGMSAVQFGIVLCMNLSVGTITPPVGTILFTGCKIGNVTIESVIKHLLPYFAMIVLALLLVTYVPALSMILPTALGLV